jgi:hypothetical protein
METLEAPTPAGLTESQSEDLQNLKLITNLQDDQKARFYMQMCDWNIDAAINLVMETEPNLAPHISDPTPDQTPMTPANQNPDSPPQQAYSREFQLPANIPVCQELLNDPMASVRSMGEIPLLTPDQKKYQKSLETLSQPPTTWPSYLASPFRFVFTGWQKSTGKIFLNSIQKLTKKKVLVNFSTSHLQDTLQDHTNSSQVPILFYLQKTNFPHNQKIINNLFCNPEIAAFINVNF